MTIVNKLLSEFGGTPIFSTAEEDNTERTTIAERAWLAGIFDGEGSVILNRRGDKSPYVGFHITNTSLEMMFKCKSILERILGEEVKVKERVFKTRKLGIRPIYNVDLRNQRKLKMIFEAIIPFLTCKFEKVMLVYNYICSRIRDLEKSSFYKQALSEESKLYLDDVIGCWGRVTTEREALLKRKMELQSDPGSNVGN